METVDEERAAASGEASDGEQASRDRADLLPRPALVQRLAEGTQRRLTLLSASAGSGKTTLLAQWRASAAGQRAATAWVTLEPADAEVGRLLRRIAAALSPLGAPPAPSAVDRSLAGLLTAAARPDRDLVLVLDDCHRARSTALDALLAEAIERLPARAHLVLSGRSAPPLALGRLRARGELCELRDAELRAGVEDATTLLGRASGIPFAPGLAAEIAARTEGWVGGLRLAASIAAARGDAAALDAFSGTHRAVADYFEEEVLGRAAPHLRDFLVRTAGLERLCGPLCDALLPVELRAGPSGQQLLEQLDRENLFLVPLDEERRWWRHHRLFAEFLRRVQEVERSSELPELHRRARTWLEGHGAPEEAARHAFAAGELEDACRLLEGAGRTRLAPRKAALLLDLVRALPEALVASRPALRAMEAWALLSTGHGEAAEALLPRPGARAPGWMHGETDALRAVTASLRGRPHRGQQLARRSLRALPRGASSLRALAHLALGTCHEVLGERQRARTAYLRVRALADGRDAVLSAIAAAQLGDDEVARGSLREASRHYEDALRLAPLLDDAQAAAMAAARLGGVYYEWNDLAGAERQLSAALAFGSAWDSVDIPVNACMQLARVRQALGDTAAALRLAERAAGLMRGRMLSRATAGVAEALRVRLWLSQGDLEAASRWLATEGPPSAWREERHANLVARLRVQLARGEFAAVAAQVRRALRAARSADHAAEALELRALLALSEAGLGRAGAARDALDAALALAQPGGWARLFLDEGEPMMALLAQAARRRSAVSAYARGLLAAGRPRAAREADGASSSPSASSAGGMLLEPLSEREREILRHVAEGLANPEIARRLFVSLATVKTHINNVYGKLGARSRTDAVARAHRAGLV